MSASGILLVLMDPPPSGPPPILPFESSNASTAGQSVVHQGTRNQRSDNSVSYAYINGRPQNGPVYDEKENYLSLLLRQMLIILFVAVVYNSTKQVS